MRNNSWLESLLLFNKLRIYLESQDKWSKRVKDILCLEFLIYFSGGACVILYSSIMLFWNSFVVPIFTEVTISIYNFENGIYASTPPSFSFDFKGELKLVVKFVVISLIFFILGYINSVFLKKFNEKSQGTIWTFCGLFIITLSIFIYSIPLQLVFLVIPILMLIIYRVPLGQGSYLKILRYLDYLFEAFKDYVIKEDLKQIMVISIIWSIFVTSLFQMNKVSVGF